MSRTTKLLQFDNLQDLEATCSLICNEFGLTHEEYNNGKYFTNSATGKLGLKIRDVNEELRQKYINALGQEIFDSCIEVSVKDNDWFGEFLTKT